MSLAAMEAEASFEENSDSDTLGLQKVRCHIGTYIHTYSILHIWGVLIVERWLVLDVHTTDEKISKEWPHFTYVFDGHRPFLHVPLPENFRRFEFLLRECAEIT